MAAASPLIRLPKLSQTKDKVMRSGRHFLQIPGPTNTPERILRAMHRSVIDHRGPEFAELGQGLLKDLKRVFKTETM